LRFNRRHSPAIFPTFAAHAARASAYEATAGAPDAAANRVEGEDEDDEEEVRGRRCALDGSTVYALPGARASNRAQNARTAAWPSLRRRLRRRACALGAAWSPAVRAGFVAVGAGGGPGVAGREGSSGSGVGGRVASGGGGMARRGAGGGVAVVLRRRGVGSG
jgi:hypothetical protein